MEKIKNFWNKYKKKWYFWVILSTVFIYTLVFFIPVKDEAIPEVTTTFTSEITITNLTETESISDTKNNITTTEILYQDTTKLTVPTSPTSETITTTKEQVNKTTTIITTEKPTTTTTEEVVQTITVWVTPSGKKYHIDKECPGDAAYAIQKPIDSISSGDWCGTCSKEMK
jgi:hypothetical protein